jgi:isovaleryl-CoA dehydrogenase
VRSPGWQDAAVSAFALNDDQVAIRTEAERFCRNELGPLSGPMDDDEHWPDEVFPKLGAQGYLGLTIPEEFGGQGIGLLEAGLVSEVMHKWNPAIGLSWAAHDNLCANNIYRNGSDEQRRRFLPGLCDGSKVGALGLTEPGAGSDALGSMAMTAVRDGDEYVLNGNKTYITNGPIADLVLAYAKTDPAAGSRGISAFVVDTATPGFEVAQKLIKQGFRGSQTGELVFSDCRVPAENLIGGENQGVAVVMNGLDIERTFLAPGSVGMAERCYELALEHAEARKQFDRPVADFQVIQHKLADMWVGIETARTYCYRVLEMCAEVEAGEGISGELHAHSAAAILYAAEMHTRVADQAVQIHGGAGYIWEMEVNRLYRAAKLLEIGAGTSEIRRNIIADHVRSTASPGG